MPHNESFVGDGTLAVRHGLEAVPSPSPGNERVSILSKESEHSDQKRNSAASNTSTLNSNPPAGKGRKRTIGPWHLGATIGKGGTSTVRLVRHMVTGQKAVAKIVSKHDAERARAVSMAHLQAVDPGDRVIPFGLEREVTIMKLLKHKNIVQLYDVWENRWEMYVCYLLKR
jgi:serine/threonine-protein kinase HSL1, negative regulator of Swe1 kinase